jgi:transposase
MSATPVPIRKAIVRAFHKEHLTYVQIAAVLGIGEATVSRVLRLYRETASVKRRPHRGAHFSPIRGPIARLLSSILKGMPDSTVAELTVVLRERTGLKTSRSSVLRALHRQGYSRKKSPSRRSSAPGRRTSLVAESSAHC